MIRTYQYDVTTSASKLGVFDNDINNGMTVWLRVESGGHNVYIGGDDQVNASAGYHLPNNTVFGPIGLSIGEVLWAVSDKAEGVDVRVLATGT